MPALTSDLSHSDTSASFPRMRESSLLTRMLVRARTRALAHQQEGGGWGTTPAGGRVCGDDLKGFWIPTCAGMTVGQRG